jgi:hypothetical protein
MAACRTTGTDSRTEKVQGVVIALKTFAQGARLTAGTNHAVTLLVERI